MISILIGDCRERMKELPDASVDSVVCDPPYHLTNVAYDFRKTGSGNDRKPRQIRSAGFMNQEWDGGDVAFQPETWAEVLRVLKPGGHLVAFSGTRTYHRMVCAIEDAGFEVRDQLAWVYGSGFPKSLDVSKAIDKAAYSAPLFNIIRNHLCEWKNRRGYNNKRLNEALGLETSGCGMARHWTSMKGEQHSIPSKDQWRNLKRVLQWPDCELDATYDAVKDGAERPVVEVRSLPNRPGFAGERFGEVTSNDVDITAPATEAAQQWQGWGTALKPSWEPICLARKPLIGSVASNVLAHGTGALNIDGCRIEHQTVAGGNLAQNPHLRKTIRAGKAENLSSFDLSEHDITPSPLGRWPANLCHDGSDEVVAGFPAEAGGGFGVRGASTRIYGGGKGLTPATGESVGFGDSGSAARFFYCAKSSSDERGEDNTHPTVKPIALMRWLVRLVTPPGGTVLDPFMGSGSTLIAADAEQFNAIGCEMSPEYAAIAEKRIRDAAGMFADVKVAA